MLKYGLLTGACAFALTGLHGVSAVAQESQEEEAQLTQDTIIVSARKKEEALIDAPVAVSAFDESAIENLQLKTVDDVARFTPGLSFSKAFGRSTERPVIRGQSNVLAGVQFGVESGTAYFIDGVYYAGSIQNLDINDVQRVEVIKGPQSALYGRNTYAGAINFITKGGSDEFEAGGKLRVASYDTVEASAYIAGPISESLSGRATFRSYEYGGQYTNAVTGQKVGDESTFSLSGVLDWMPTSNFDTRLRVQYTEDDDGPLPIFLQSAAENNCAPGYRSLSSWPLSGSGNVNQYYCGVVSPGQVALNTGPDRDGVPNLVDGVPPNSTYPFFNGLPFLPPFGQGGAYNLGDGTVFDGIEREQTILSLISNYDFAGGHTLSFLGGYREEDLKQGFDSDHSSVNLFHPFLGDEAFFANTTLDEVEDYSLELKLSSPTDKRFRWSGGVYYYKQDVANSELTFADPDGSDNPTGDTSVENQAIFGLVEYDFTDKISVTLEGRYAEETKTDTSSTAFPEATFDAFTPRLTVDYALENGGSLYAIYAQGVKPGGINGSEGEAVGFPTYEQEESDNFEIGFKTPLFDDRFTLTAAGYFTDATNVQLTSAIGTPSGALNSIATNQGAGEILGLELDISGRFNKNWSGGTSYSWTDSEFTEGCDPDEWTLTSGGGVLTDQQNETGTDFTAAFPGSGPATCSIEGKQFPLTSEHQASAFLRYDLSGVGPAGSDFFASTNMSYESSKFVQVHNRAETGDATILGARLGFEHDNWTFNIYGENLTDEDSIVIATRWLQIPYFTFASPNSAPAGASTSSPRSFFGTLRRGTQVGAELSVRF